MPAADPRVIRVATYNVLDPGLDTLAPWEERRANIARTIEGAAPGILALQEAGWARVMDDVTLAEDVARLTGLTLSRAAFSGDAVLFDPRAWIPLEHGHFRLPRARGDIRRSAVWHRLRDAHTGESLLVVATHLSHSPRRARARRRQARALVRRIRCINRARLPVVVVGDLNSWPGRDPVTPMDVLAEAGYRDARESEAPAENAHLGTWVGGGRGLRLDHIAVSARVTVLRTRVEDPPLDGPASDHRMLWADLVVAGP
jgi:endonuclease/exonuclease/phosphatase family metal-dependent hydrolase